jgi:fibro-slime domain-containing protein
MRPITYAMTAALLGWLVAACGGSDSDEGSGARASTGTAQGSGGDAFSTTIGAGAAGASSGTGIPSNFIPADQGAYALGQSITGDGVENTGVSGEDGCNILVGVTRDFKGLDEPGGHPDFEDYNGGVTPGLVEVPLGADDKPTFAGRCDEADGGAGCPNGQMLTNQMYFDQWYRYTADVNKPYLIYFQFAQNGNISTFESSSFFPLDGTGWGNSGTDHDDNMRNFHFTTELHTQFRYAGGEVFTFTGDDDLWVFVNGTRAIDLGGVHGAETATLDVDQAAATLGITTGNVYSLDLFHAERHTHASNFRVDTDLAFVDCGTVPPDVK